MAPDPDADAAFMYFIARAFHVSICGDFDYIPDTFRVKAELLARCNKFIEVFDDGAAGAVHLSLTEVGAYSEVFTLLCGQPMPHVGVPSALDAACCED